MSSEYTALYAINGSVSYGAQSSSTFGFMKDTYYHLTHQRECRRPLLRTVSLLLVFPAFATPVRSSLQPMQLFTIT